ncbi:MAG: ACT domain-containing protein [Promethearchaeota archaeon]
MKDLSVILEDRPGTLADLCEVLGRVGINIEGLCGIPCEGKGIAHILVEDAAAARSTLEEAGFEVSAERDVLLLNIENKHRA